MRLEKKIALDAIKRMTVAGNTFLSGGLLEAVRIIRSRTAPFNEVASVLLFTDGHANKGISDPEQLVEAISTLNYVEQPTTYSVQNTFSDKDLDKQNTTVVNTNTNNQDTLQDYPFTIYTFGYQKNHNATLLRRIAEYSKSGVYFFIEHKDSIAESFADCLGGLLSVVAQNINITVKVCGDNEVKILNELQKVEVIPNKEIIVKFGDIQSEESKDILCEIVVPAIEPTDEFYLLEWKIEYFNVLNLTQKELFIKTSVARNNNTPPEININVDMQYNRIITAKALKEAEEARQNRKFDEGKQLLEAAVAQLESSVSVGTEYTKQLITDLKQAIQELGTRKEEGSYYMQNVYDKHNKQRSNFSSDVTYVTSKKAQKKFESRKKDD